MNTKTVNFGDDFDPSAFNTVTTEAPAPALDIPVAGDTAQAQVQATTAIAEAQATSLAQARKIRPALEELYNAVDTTVIRDISAADEHRLVATNGGVFTADSNKEVGRVITIEVFSINKRFTVGISDDQNNAESKELLRYSYDGVTLENDNRTVDEYVAHLKEVGYESAHVTEYTDLLGLILEADGKPYEGESMVVVQLAPSSARNFMVARTQQSLRESKGLVKPSSLLEIRATPRATKAGKNYTNFTITFLPPAQS
jgi:hypothetical protein